MSRTVEELLQDPLTRCYMYEANKYKGFPPHNQIGRNEEIKELHRNGWSYAEIGRRFGISRQCVFMIVNGIKKN